MELHGKICSKSFKARAEQSLTEVCEVLSQMMFVDVHHMVKGGSVGKGVAIAGQADAEVVLFLKGLPKLGHERWLPPLLRAVAGVLSQQVGGEGGIQAACVRDDAVQVS